MRTVPGPDASRRGGVFRGAVFVTRAVQKPLFPLAVRGGAVYFQPISIAVVVSGSCVGMKGAGRTTPNGDSDVKKMTVRTTLAVALSCALILPAMSGPARAGFEWTPPPRALPKAPVAAAEELPPVSAAPAVPVESAPLAAMPVADNDAVAAARAEAAAQAAMNEGAPVSAPPSDPWAEQAGAEETMPVLSDDPMGRIAAPGTPVPRGPNEPVIMPRHTAMQVAAPVPPPAMPVDPATIPPSPFMKAAPVPVMPMNAAPGFTDAVGFGRDIPLALALQQIVPAGYSFAFTGGADAGTRVSWEGGRPWNIVLADALAPHGMVPAIAGNTVWVSAGVPAAPYYAAPVPVTAMPMPVAPASPATASWRPVNDWQDEANYAPSYPRRDPVAARERMMQEAAGAVQQQEPSGNDPDIVTQPTSTGDETAAMNGPAGAPMPLLAAEPPAATPEPAGKTYTQLTGLDNTMMKGLDAHEIRYWQAQPGESLRTVLTNWSEQAGVQLFWAEGQDYQMPAPVQMHGTFQSAITKVLESFSSAQPQPQGQLHPNYPNGPAVLIIDHRA